MRSRISARICHATAVAVGRHEGAGRPLRAAESCRRRPSSASASSPEERNHGGVDAKPQSARQTHDNPDAHEKIQAWLILQNIGLVLLLPNYIQFRS